RLRPHAGFRGAGSVREFDRVADRSTASVSTRQRRRGTTDERRFRNQPAPGIEALQISGSQSTNCSELRYNFEVHLAIFNERPEGATETHFERFTKDNILERLREIDQRARNGGLRALDASDPLVAIGVETDPAGIVTKNSYGVLNLSWQAQLHPEWA